jgi:hypothetical protein
MTFPQYRKYPNNKTFFKIVSDREFEEISYIGSKQLVQTTTAKTFAELMYIKDMLDNTQGYYEVINEEEYGEEKINN